jgi:hypothetical protein
MSSKVLSGSSQTAAAIHESIDMTVQERRIYLDARLAPSIPFAFANAWDEFVGAVEGITGTVSCTDHEQAWDHFRPVFSKKYADEADFSNALFDALKEALADVCVEVTHKETKVASRWAPSDFEGSDAATVAGGATWKRKMMLGRTNIGFATGFYRRLAGDFGIQADHACVVFRRGENDVHPKKKSRLTKSQIRTSVLHEDDDGYGGIDLKKEHGPIGIALMHMMEVWGSLTRRGRAPPSMPVVLLAGRKAGVALNNTERHAEEFGATLPQGKTMVPSPAGVKLCCMLAELHIPLRLGGQFRLQIGRQVKFSEGDNEDNSKEAMAIYLSAMKGGLQHAKALKVVQEPRSRCCQVPGERLKLVASPMLRASPANQFSIHQGELFRFTGDNGLSIGEWIAPFREVRCLADSGLAIKNCLVKLSSITVHNTLVPLDESWTAFQKLDSSPEKIVVSDVLLACAFIERRCLVTVMKDLSAQADQFQALSYDCFQDRQAVWLGFCNLVRNVLLPMANVGIVHADIRCVPGSHSKFEVYNILGKRDSGGSIELKLIDFESLVIFSTALIQIPCHPHAISVGTFENDFRSPHEFVFWQVLWMTYVLWCPSDRGNKPSGVDVEYLFNNLFHAGADETRLADFKEWLTHPRHAKLKATYDYFKALRESFTMVSWDEQDHILAEVRIEGPTQVEKTLNCLEAVFKVTT